MPKEPTERLYKITLNLFEEDHTFLQAFYRKTGYQRALRLLARKHVRELQRLKDKRGTRNGGDLGIELGGD